MDRNGIDEYIRANRDRYSDEAIREKLTSVGGDPAAIDEAFHRLGLEARQRGAAPGESDMRATGRTAARSGIIVYAVIWFIVGLLLASTVGANNSIPWFVPAYLVVGGGVAFLITRVRVSGWGWLLAVPLIPVVFAFVWFGTCVAAYNASH